MSFIVSQIRMKRPHTLSKIILMIEKYLIVTEAHLLNVFLSYSDWHVNKDAKAIAKSFFFSSAKTLDILSIQSVMNLSSTKAGVCFSLRATSAIT